MVRKKLEEKAKEVRARHKASTKPFEKESRFPRASEFIRSIEAVETIFPYVDWKSGIGGSPLSRIVVVHGPSAEGKSLFVLGLMRSYLERGHVVGYGDVEHTTTPEFARQFMGETFDSENFLAIPCGTYDQFRKDVRSLYGSVHLDVKEGRRPPETRVLVVVDSLKNLQPKSIFEELAKDAKEGGNKGKRQKGVDGFGGRGGQLKAQYNDAWFVELASLMHEVGGTIVIIVRETVEESTRAFEDDKIKLVGGKEVRFGNHWQLRITRSELIDKETGVLLGERHGVETHKTKLAGRDVSKPFAVFHTRFGETHEFDRARDVFELGVDIHAIEQSGAWYSFGGERLGQGSENCVERLRSDSELRDRIEAACRALFKSVR